ncbi:GntR family transcriptional regulator [Nocardia australiensis]|uniref:GntR family transcriptional regulator n=1 Tax=Nocardia australiensis TaxID=2887191 RepID=UPI001D1447D4|nr:GntR family transcriptional regulator [Nocardia australiensis]
MTKGYGNGTRADEAYRRLRAEIFTGRLEPGQRLKFPELCAQMGISVGVLREALVRLVGERLVALQAHQGYAVASLSSDELTDLTTARVEFETHAFGLSMSKGADSWESEVVAAHHLLTLRERDVLDGGVRGDGWFAAHEAFHGALVAGCGSRRIIAITSQLRAETELYRRWAAPLLYEFDRDPAAEHQALVDAALARDIDKGIAVLRNHIAFTTQMLLCHLDSAALTADSKTLKQVPAR